MPTPTIINRVLKLIKEAGSEGLTARDLLLHDVGTRTEMYGALKQLRGKDVQMQKEGRFIRYRAAFVTPALQSRAEEVIKTQQATRRRSSTRTYHMHLPGIIELAAEKAVFGERWMSVSEVFRLAEREYFEKRKMIHLMRQPVSPYGITGFEEMFNNAHQALLDRLLDNATAPKFDLTSIPDQEFLAEFVARLPRLDRRALHSMIDTVGLPAVVKPKKVKKLKSEKHIIFNVVAPARDAQHVADHIELRHRIACGEVIFNVCEVSSTGGVDSAINRHADHIVVLSGIVTTGSWYQQLIHKPNVHRTHSTTGMRDTIVRLTESWERANHVTPPPTSWKMPATRN